MASESIKCPECGAKFELSKAVSHDIEISVAKRYEKQIKDLKELSEKSLQAKEKELYEQHKKDKTKLEQRNKKELEEAVSQLDSDRKKIEEKARKKAQKTVGLEIADYKEQLAEKDKKLAEGQQAELSLRKRQRGIEERERSLKIETARQIDTERQQIIENAKTEYEEAHKLKDAEKDKKLADAQKRADELRRKLEQGSQQTQGEVLELELEEMLREECQFDLIEPVTKGIKGGDIIHTVKTQSGKICGKILWETKRTKTWSDKWLQKVKEDQRDAKADIAVIVSEILPQGMCHFRQIGGVWVASISSSRSLAIALRVNLMQVAREKILQAGKQEKTEVVYNYLTGPEFRNRVEAFIEAFITMRDDLERERRAITKIWDKREKQIQKVILNVSGMHGDLEGIAGMTLPAVKALEFPEHEIEDKKVEQEKENVSIS